MCAPGLYWMLSTGVCLEDSSLMPLRLIWFGTRHLLKKATWERFDTASWFWSCSSSQCYTWPRSHAGLWADYEAAYMTKVASSCFYHLRRLKQIRWLVGKAVTAQLVSAFILSRLDYCNALLAGLPRATIEPLQRLQKCSISVCVTTSHLHWATPLVTSCKQN